jgi:hypothetical protein
MGVAADEKGRGGMSGQSRVGSLRNILLQARIQLNRSQRSCHAQRREAVHDAARDASCHDTVR